MSNRPMYTTKEAVERWLKARGVERYSIGKDLSVKVNGHVSLCCRKLAFIPVNFSKIYGYFDISDNPLESLDGAPTYVQGNFDCSDCGLYSLEGGPQVVKGEYRASKNNLVDLLGGAVETPYLDLQKNHLTSLHNLPKQLDVLLVAHNELTDFEGFSSYVKNRILLENNPLSSWEGLSPEHFSSECKVGTEKTKLPQWEKTNKEDKQPFNLKGKDLKEYLQIHSDKKALEQTLKTEFLNKSSIHKI